MAAATPAAELARQLVETRRRLAAVERGSQLPFSTLGTASGADVDLLDAAEAGLESLEDAAGLAAAQEELEAYSDAMAATETLLAEEAADRELRLAQAEDDMEASKVRLDAAEAEINTLTETTLPALQVDLDEAKATLAPLPGLIQTNADAVAAAKGRLDTLDSVTIPGLNDEITAAEGRLATAESTLAPLPGKISAAESDITDAFGQIATVDGKVTTAQSTADTAKADAATAAGIAGGKADVLIQSTAPAVAMRKATTLWIDTTGGANTPKRWNGSTWAAVTDKAATDAATAAANAATAAAAADSKAVAAQTAAQTAQAAADAASAKMDAAIAKASSLYPDASLEVDRGPWTGGANFSSGMSRVAEGARTGSYALKMVTTGAAGNLFTYTPWQTLPANSVVYAEFWVYPDPATWQAGKTINLWSSRTTGPNGTGTGLASQSITSTPTAGQWNKVSGYFKLDANQSIRVLPLISTASNSPAGQVLYLDDFKVVDVTEHYALYAESLAAAQTAQAAAGTAQSTADAALTMAGSKSKVYYSTATATGTATADGDLWRQRDASNNIIGEWRWNGTPPAGSWVKTAISSEAISNLDVGKLTAGAATIDSAVINKMAVGIATVIQLNADRITAGKITSTQIDTVNLAASIATIINLNADRITAGTINTARLNTTELSTAIATIISLNADRITAGTINTARLNVSEIAAQVATVIQLNADKIVSGTISTARLNAVEIAAATAAFQTVDVANLFASAATMDTAVAQKIYTAKLSASKILASEVLIGGGANLLVDPRMQSKATWDNSTYWRVDGGKDGDGSFFLQQSTSQLGAYSGASNAAARVPVVAGSSYRISAWVKTSTAAPIGSLAVYGRVYNDADGTFTFSTPSAALNDKVTVANTWTPVTGIVTIPEGRTSLAIGLYKQAAYTTGTVTWSNPAVQPVADGSLIVDGAIDGKIITGATMRTAPAGARVEMDASGLHAYNASGIETFDLDAATGNVSATGSFQTSMSGRRAILSDRGNLAAADFYPDTSAQHGALFTEVANGKYRTRLYHFTGSTTARGVASFQEDGEWYVGDPAAGGAYIAGRANSTSLVVSGPIQYGAWDLQATPIEITYWGTFRAYSAAYQSAQVCPNGKGAGLRGMVGTSSATISMTAGTLYSIGAISPSFAPPKDDVIAVGCSQHMGGSGQLYVRSTGQLDFTPHTSFTSITSGQFFIMLTGTNWLL